MDAVLALGAMLVEVSVGYPDALFRRIRHPVVWVGSLISLFDRALNKGPARRRRMAGAATIVAVAALAWGAGALPQALLPGLAGLGAAMLLGSALIAQRSLAAHVRRVADALDRDGLEAGRAAVSRIVGRDPDALDEAGVARAAVESLAENFSDGVVAPVFWMTVAGLPGAAAYKAVNTADSMIGHKNDRYRAFGWAAARLDDLVNLPASRLTAALLCLAALVTPGASARNAVGSVWRDAGRHRSPNAGWPEAAMAGALGLALAGPRRYGGQLVDDAVMGAGGRRELGAGDIRRALRLYWTADALLAALVAALVIALF